MSPDYISPIIGIPIALFLWALLFSIVFYKPVKSRIDDFFALRRHNRRMRKMREYLIEDLNGAQAIFTPNEIRAAYSKPLSQNNKRGRHAASKNK